MFLTPYNAGTGLFSTRSSRLFDTWFDDIFDAVTQETSYDTLETIESTDSHIILGMDIPGVDPKDIKAEFVSEKSLLDISAIRTLKKGKRTIKRTLSIDSTIYDTDSIDISASNGVLQIKLKKKDKVKPRLIPIEIK